MSHMMNNRNFTQVSEFPAIPENPDLERQVIAELISFPMEIMEAERIIDEDTFTSEERKAAWITLSEMFHNGDAIDLPTFFSKSDKGFMLKEIMPQLNKVGSGASIISHCEVLREYAIKRRAYFSAVDLLRHSSCSTSTINDIISTSSSLIESINQDYKEDVTAEKLCDTINRLADDIQKNQYDRQQGKQTRIPTGFRFLDKFTYSGFNAGQLIILAARPSVGKTAVMLQMAKEAVNSGFPATIFSLEMTNTELAQRLLFSTGMITPKQVARGEIVWKDFESAAGQFASAPMYLNDSANTIDEIVSRIVLGNKQGKCSIAFIDYLGLIRHTNSRQPLYQIIAEVTKRLKQVAKECRIPIVLLCQLNRASAAENRPPALYDLRDSGSIEQDADIVLMLERDNDYLPAVADTTSGCINMWIRKNRQGKAGDIAIKLVANNTFTSFNEISFLQS